LVREGTADQSGSALPRQPEFLNRIDETIVFHRLDEQQLRQIVELIVNGTRRLLHAQDVGLDVTTAAEDWLAENGFDPKFGARPLRRTIQRELDNKLSGMLLKGTVKPGDTVKVDADTDGLVFETVSGGGAAGAGQTAEVAEKSAPADVGTSAAAAEGRDTG
jgi:ATP-dependent Clp protease ATP-binding subunit ClpC